jgi:hypothetical protein
MAKVHDRSMQEILDDEEVIRRFEAGEVSEAGFHHIDHVRLAFAFLRSYSVLKALEKFSCALKRFAESRGKAQLYNETITCAYFFLIHERMAAQECESWEKFAAQNSDLLGWKDGILGHYYREKTLKSELARRIFVLPDRCLDSA